MGGNSQGGTSASSSCTKPTESIQSASLQPISEEPAPPPPVQDFAVDQLTEQLEKFNPFVSQPLLEFDHDPADEPKPEVSVEELSHRRR